MTGCILDSDVLIQLLRKDAKAVGDIASIPIPARHTTIITCSELLYGAYNSAAVERNLAVTHQLLNELTILPLTYECCEQYGALKALLRKRGITIGDKDLLIAAIAVSHNLPIFTYNLRDFGRVPGLKLHPLSR